MWYQIGEGSGDIVRFGVGLVHQVLQDVESEAVVLAGGGDL